MQLPVSPTILLAAASVALLCGPFLPVRASRIVECLFLIVGLVAGYFLFTEPVIAWDAIPTSERLLVWKNDGLAISEQWIILTFGFLIGFSILDSPLPKRNPSKFGGFLLYVLAGLMLVATANDFLALGLSLEIVSLSLTAWQRQLDCAADMDLPAASTTKVDFNPSFANGWFNPLLSVWMWLGIALLSNATATTNFDQLRSVLTEAYDPAAGQSPVGAASKLILLAIGLIATSLFARMGLVPFHRGFFGSVLKRSHWNSIYGLLASQIAGAMTLTRLFGYSAVGLSQSFVVLSVVLTLATFALSAIAALRGLAPGTRSIRDLVASFTLLQAGWLAIGPMIVAAELDHPALRWGTFPNQSESVAIVLFAQIAGLMAGCGLCCALGYLARSDRRIEFLEDVKGLVQFGPLASIVLMSPLVSQVACPWTAGFWGRWLTLLSGHNVHVKSTSSILTPQYAIRMAILAGVLATIAFSTITIRLAREIFLEAPLARHPATGGRGPLLVGSMMVFGGLLLGVDPHLALGPLAIIHSPRADVPRVPERGSGRNSLGFKNSPSIHPSPESISGQ